MSDKVTSTRFYAGYDTRKMSAATLSFFEATYPFYYGHTREESRKMNENGPNGQAKFQTVREQ